MFISPELLFSAYLGCRKHKRTKNTALEFEIDYPRLLYLLYKELNNKTYKVGKSIVFCVTKPVKREIFAACFRDRVVQHLVLNELKPLFEEEFILDTYSCRDKKGTLYGIQRCYDQIKEASQDYSIPTIIIKADALAFFVNISKKRLYDKLYDLIDRKYEYDKDYLSWLVHILVFDCPLKHCIRRQPLHMWNDLPKHKSLFNKDDDTGIPIGNVTSQWFANYYFNVFDHWVYEELGIKYYGRYVDDFYIIVNEFNYDIIVKCREKLKEEGIILHPNKIYIQEVRKGVAFLGAMIKPHRIYAGKRLKNNFYKRLHYVSKLSLKTKCEIEWALSCLNSYLGSLKKYKSYNIRKKFIVKHLIDTPFRVDINLTKLCIRL